MFWFLHIYHRFNFDSQLTHEPPAASDRITIKLQKQTRQTSQWARDPEITEAAAQSGAELGFMAARLKQTPSRRPHRQAAAHEENLDHIWNSFRVWNRSVGGR